MKVSELRCQICPATSADGPLYNTKTKDDGWRCKKHLGDFQADAAVAHIAEAIHRGESRNDDAGMRAWRIAQRTES